MNPQLSLFDFSAPLQKTPEKKFLPPPQAKKERGPLNKPETKYNSQKPLSQIYAEVLVDYLPENSVTDVCNVLAKHKVFVRITGKRFTKLGDYHPPQNGNGHKITINHNLNKYSFLITLIHELAHLATWEKHKRNAKPHGREWKTGFREMMSPFIHRENFPEEIIFALNNYLQNPAASSCTDTNLLKILRKFDAGKGKEKNFHLEDIPENSVFKIIGSSKFFRKGKKLRKRFRCKDVNSKRIYLVSPLAEVSIAGEKQVV